MYIGIKPLSNCDAPPSSRSTNKLSKICWPYLWGMPDVPPTSQMDEGFHKHSQANFSGKGYALGVCWNFRRQSKTLGCQAANKHPWWFLWPLEVRNNRFLFFKPHKLNTNHGKLGLSSNKRWKLKHYYIPLSLMTMYISRFENTLAYSTIHEHIYGPIWYDNFTGKMREGPTYCGDGLLANIWGTNIWDLIGFYGDLMGFNRTYPLVNWHSCGESPIVHSKINQNMSIFYGKRQCVTVDYHYQHHRGPMTKCGWKPDGWYPIRFSQRL